VAHHQKSAAAKVTAPAASKSFASAICFPSGLVAERSQDLAPKGDEHRVVAVARIGKIDGEFRLDARGPFAEHDHPRREQQRFLHVVRDQNGGEALVPPEGDFVAWRLRRARWRRREINYATRTQMACPRSRIRLSDLTAIATSVTRRASSRNFKISPITRL